MALEIERKWLINRIPNGIQDGFSINEIRQAYVLNKAHTVLRVRSIREHQDGEMFNEYGVITVKGPSDVENAPREYEMEIPIDLANNLISGCNVVLLKRRHNIPYGEHLIELDIFEGKLNGLIVAEVEFSGLDDRDSFVAPDWFGLEVTGMHTYANSNLIKLDKAPEEIQ
jgi:CYTH domain-containing protein